MRPLLTAFLLFTTYFLSAQQSAVGFGLKAYTLNDADLGTVSYYITEKGIGQTKPVLLYLEGSGCYPLYRIVDDGQNCCLYMKFHYLDLDSLSQYYHVVLLSKPGVPLADTVRVKNYDEYTNAAPLCSDTYTQKLSLQWRARAASLVLDHLTKRIPYDKSRVIVLGNSEGGQVAPKAAVLNRKITHCINICGSGINQFYTPVIKTRMQARKGEITYEEAERRVDSLFTTYKNIYSHQNNTSSDWEGSSYLRWSSFTQDPPLNSYVQLKIPIYIAIGARDENGDVLSSDYVQLEFLRLGKTNLTYKVYPNADHFFNEIMEVDGQQRKVSRTHEVIRTALHWSETKKQP